MRSSILPALASSALLTMPVQAQQQIWQYFDAGGDAAAVTYAACGPEEAWGECVTLSFGCASVDDMGFEIFVTLVAHENAADVVNELMTAEWEDIALRFELGSISVAVRADRLEVTHNDMIGGWGIMVRTMEGGELFGALVGQNLEGGAALVAGGQRIDLLPNGAADIPYLIELGETCAS
jgi:hypothetical protein